LVWITIAYPVKDSCML